MNDGFAEYSGLLGKTIANLQSLEFSLRHYLYETQDSYEALFRRPFNDLRLGERVPENSLTDWSSLGQLIDRYNKAVSAEWPELVVDSSIVNLRDALAHGRMWIPEGAAGPVLAKFDKPRDGITCVTFWRGASSRWLEEALHSVHIETVKVQTALQRR